MLLSNLRWLTPALHPPAKPSRRHYGLSDSFCSPCRPRKTN